MLGNRILHTASTESVVSARSHVRSRWVRASRSVTGPRTAGELPVSLLTAAPLLHRLSQRRSRKCESRRSALRINSRSGSTFRVNVLPRCRFCTPPPSALPRCQGLAGLQHLARLSSLYLDFVGGSAIRASDASLAMSVFIGFAIERSVVLGASPSREV